jgi:hypothetical protein
MVLGYSKDHGVVKKIVKLLEKRILLLVAPSIRSTFEGKFNEAKVTDGAVKKLYILVIASCSISILQRSIEIKISHEDPKAIQVNLFILKQKIALAD